MKKKFIICTLSLILMVSAYSISYAVGRFGINIPYGFQEKNEIPTIVAQAGSEIIISNLTDIYVESVDLNTHQTTQEKIKTPVSYIGLTRNRLTQVLNDEFENIELSEKLKGLISMEVVSFEKTKVVIRKTYSDSSLPEDFYLYEQDGYIVIYLGDGETFYDYTDIAYEDLDWYTQYYIGKGLYIKNSKELYGFLQNYSN